MIAEKWLHVEDFPRYLVSQLGNVYDCVSDRLLVQTRNKKGYHKVTLVSSYGSFTVSVHRLVAKTFFDVDTLTNEEVNHRDGDKSNNCLWNLEWTTRSGNMRHAYAMGLMSLPKHEIKIRCVETSQVFQSMTEAAQYFGVSVPSISKAVNRTHKTCRGYHFVTVDLGGEAHDHS